jgi:hypothetical protein
LLVSFILILVISIILSTKLLILNMRSKVTKSTIKDFKILQYLLRRTVLVEYPWQFTDQVGNQDLMLESFLSSSSKLSLIQNEELLNPITMKQNKKFNNNVDKLILIQYQSISSIII